LTPFSKRHKEAIQRQDLCLRLPKPLRQKLVYCMRKYDRLVPDMSSAMTFQELSAFRDVLKRHLLEAYGDTHLRAYVDDVYRAAASIEDFILGAKPEQVLDALELYAASLDPHTSIEFHRECNEKFQSEGSPFRIHDGCVVKLDSEFLESEVLSRAYELLRDNRFEKACMDFLNARNKLTAGDYPGAVVEANNALESALKKVLNKEKGGQGELKKHLRKSGLIPDYFQGFCDHFEGLLQSAFTIANQSARHGKKEPSGKKDEVDYPVASFLVHLVGSVIVFIMERYDSNLADEDIPL
jgi:hypothetical protein